MTDKDRIIESLRGLHDLSKAVNSTLDIEKVVKLVLEETSRLMGSKKVLILLLDDTQRALTVHRFRGFPADGPGITRLEDTRPFEHCIVRKHAVITMRDVLDDRGYAGLLDTAPEMAGMVFAPLEVKGRAYGLLGISGNGAMFTEMKLEIFCALASQSAIAMENAGLYRRLRDSFLHTAEALAEAVNSRDPYTGGHTRRVEEYCLRFADALGLPEQERENLLLAAILHDIGKIGIDDAILRKGGLLSPEEEALMRGHPDIGARILGFVEEMRDVIPGVRHHHERYDGSGYPDGLRGESIPLHARIIAIADAYDAITTERPYRKAAGKVEALTTLREERGEYFDPELVELFCGIVQDAARKRFVGH